MRVKSNFKTNCLVAWVELSVLGDHIPLLCCPFPPFYTTLFCTISLLFVYWELSFQLKGQGPLQGDDKKDCEEVELVLEENIQKVLKPWQEGLEEQATCYCVSSIFRFSPFPLKGWGGWWGWSGGAVILYLSFLSQCCPAQLSHSSS